MGKDELVALYDEVRGGLFFAVSFLEKELEPIEDFLLAVVVVSQQADLCLVTHLATSVHEYL